jgi:hypothetical protein
MSRIREKSSGLLFRLSILFHVSNYERKLMDIVYVRFEFTLGEKYFAEYVSSII